jgi:hypothetical protein
MVEVNPIRVLVVRDDVDTPDPGRVALNAAERETEFPVIGPALRNVPPSVMAAAVPESQRLMGQECGIAAVNPEIDKIDCGLAANVKKSLRKRPGEEACPRAAHDEEQSQEA